MGNVAEGVAQALPRQIEIVSLLQIHPQISRRSKIAGEPERRVGGDGALGGDDLRDAVGRHAERARQLGGRNSDFLQLLGENLSWVNRCARHGFSLMVIDDFHVVRTIGS